MTAAELALIHGQAFTVPRPWSEIEIADLLTSPLCFVIAVPDGFAMGRVVAGEAELLTVAVRPAAQGRGTGLHLVQRFLAEAAIRGADTAFLEVADTNLAARTVYARAGFAQTGRRRDYYQPGVDALILTRKIQSTCQPA